MNDLPCKSCHRGSLIVLINLSLHKSKDYPKPFARLAFCGVGELPKRIYNNLTHSANY